MAFSFIDLFCGIGGFHVALADLGGRCVFACDIDKECRAMYEKNFGLRPEGDITKIDAKDVPDHDVLVGGFPCQPMSNAGKKRTFADKRGKLFDEIVRIARAKRPKAMILENVKHIKKVDGGKVYAYVYEELKKIGYRVRDIELSPHQFGVPQQRKRVYFVCIDERAFGGDVAIDFPDIPVIPTEPSHRIFQDRDQVPAKYDVSPDLKSVIDAWDVMLKRMDAGQRISVPILLDEFDKQYDEDALAALPDWRRTYVKKNKDLYEKYRPVWNAWRREHAETLSKKSIYSKLEWQTGPLVGDDSIWDHFVQIRQSGIRVKRSDTFPTLVAMVQVPIYGKEKRFLTPRECARLQSFPDDVKLHETDRVAYKQLGNSVNVDVVRFVADAVLSRLGVRLPNASKQSHLP